MVIKITDESIKEVLKTDKLIVIDFYADWCNPCKVISPIIEEISELYKNEIMVGKLDVDNNDDSASKYEVRNIPLVLFIKNNKILDKIVGVVPKEVFIDKVNKLK